MHRCRHVGTRQHLVILDQRGSPVDVQSDDVGEEVDEQQAKWPFSVMLPMLAMTPLPRYSG
jgi:hypothetical protein